MNDRQFKIYVERLRDKGEEPIEESLPPGFLDVHEKDLAFNAPVKISGKAYLADDMLVINLDILTAATLPCRVCNEPVETAISIEDFYHAEPIDDIKGGVYDFRTVLREAILLDTPHLAECNEGKCPQREVLKKYFKDGKEPSAGESEDEGYRPFADLDFDVKN